MDDNAHPAKDWTERAWRPQDRARCDHVRGKVRTDGAWLCLTCGANLSPAADIPNAAAVAEQP